MLTTPCDLAACAICYPYGADEPCRVCGTNTVCSCDAPSHDDFQFDHMDED